jgi:hypothetical protein
LIYYLLYNRSSSSTTTTVVVLSMEETIPDELEEVKCKRLVVDFLG